MIYITFETFLYYISHNIEGNVILVSLYKINKANKTNDTFKAVNLILMNKY